MEELIAFSPLYARFMRQFDAKPADAGFGADWYDAVGFCRWLGQQSGLSEGDQSYAAPETLNEAKHPANRIPRRTGPRGAGRWSWVDGDFACRRSRSGKWPAVPGRGRLTALAAK